MTFIPEIFSTEPYFVNEEGTRWWKNPSLQSYVDKKLPDSGIYAWFVETRSEVREFVLTDEKEVIKAGRSLEEIATYVDILAWTRKNPSGVAG